ncbi:MAG: phenylalanine--tRNA ligase subunit beta [Clostridia bacterium]|jgi:phenylalanyl-tRNA synthetase beta chain|nr:phenylalanine--tRNA ligase subunit beta [Clostridia bacterium]
MRVSWNWLKELVEIEQSPQEIAGMMTMAGVEVDSVEPLSEGISGVVTAEITSVEKHPQADRLVVCALLLGGGKTATVVSGAPNLAKGQKVPVALPGATLAHGMKIEKSNFRGIESEGMLCSADELGLDTDKLSNEDRDGIYILPEETKAGQDAVSLLGLDDVILELGLTPNRSDCLGMINVAREVASLTGGKLKLPAIEVSGSKGECADLTSVEIKEPALCKRYVARLLKDVKVGKSPLWLRQRLLAAGVRPINNIVDVTNLVMLELGQPLHAFDYDKLEGKRIVVRKPAAGEKLVTLDGQERTLQPEMLVIADAVKPVGLAGVMGGLETEVTETTQTILLEAAFFNGPNVRRTSQALGLRSEASLRFEKEIDLEQVPFAADRAVQLMAQLGAGRPVSGQVDCFPNPEERKTIVLRLERVRKILGVEVSSDVVERILSLLQIKVSKKENNTWTVIAPSYRRDIQLEEDLIEEVARLHGYDKIPTTLPVGPTTQGARTPAQTVRVKTAEILSIQGLYQVLTFSFINPRHLERLQLSEGDALRDVIPVANPLSEEQGIMRTTLLPGLLDVIGRNLNQRNKDLAVYELGKVYFNAGFPKKASLPQERYILAAAASGSSEKSWGYPAQEYDFYYLKGILENLLSRLGLGPEKVAFRAAHDIAFLHPGRSARIFIGEREAGWLGEIHPLVLANYELDQNTAAFSLDMELLSAEAEERVVYRTIPRYPAVTRDLAVLVPERVEAETVAVLIKEKGQGKLQQVRLFDLYQGRQIEKGFKSLAFALTWQAEDRTLTDEEVNSLHQDILESLAEKAGAQLRA